MDKEQVDNGDLHDCLANRPAQPLEEIAAEELSVGLDHGGEDGRRKLNDDAEEVDGAAAVAVREGDEDDASDGEPGKAEGGGNRRELVRVPEVLDEAAIGDRRNVQEDKGKEDVAQDQTKVDDLARDAPVLQYAGCQCQLVLLTAGLHLIPYQGVLWVICRLRLVDNGSGAACDVLNTCPCFGP